MAINTDLLDFVSVDELLGSRLRIPVFQRPYSWTPSTAGQLFTDVDEALRSRPGHPYVLGTVILLRRGDETHFEVVDGQQRILTLHLLRDVLRGRRLDALRTGNAPIQLVHQELVRRVDGLSRTDGELARYRDFLDSQVQVLRIVTDDEDEAFQFFDSQNYRGKALRPHDLLKAYHLREMSDATASEQRAVVEQWEEAEEAELDRLFGTYLARIHWWSRNRSAHPFTMDDIALFKGVGRSTRRLPGAEYHRAAKAVLPGLQEWATPSADDSTLRDLKRARHQIDAPLAAGRSFFHYAAFMLAETQRLEAELFDLDDDGGEPDSELTEFRDGARFRFSRELFVAAALFYQNKYSERHLRQARTHLFRWAYALRLAYERLGWRSTDNYARGLSAHLVGGGALNVFASIRDNLDPHDVPIADVAVPERARSGNDQDERLLARLREGR